MAKKNNHLSQEMISLAEGYLVFIEIFSEINSLSYLTSMQHGSNNEALLLPTENFRFQPELVNNY